MPKRKRSLHDVRVRPKEGKWYTYSSMVKVVVGKEEDAQTFLFHEDVLRDQSEFFQRALNGNWKESDEKVIELRDEDPETFLLYAQLVYAKVLAVKTESPDCENLEEKGEYEILAELYVLAEMLQDTTTRNVVLEAIIAKSREEYDEDEARYYPSSDAVNTIYKGTPEKSPARRLMVDFYAIHGDEDWISDGPEDFEKDFLFDLAQELFKKRTYPSETTDCYPNDYHIPVAVLAGAADIEVAASGSETSTEDGSGNSAEDGTENSGEED